MLEIVERERILLIGSPGSGKSQAIVDIATTLRHVPVVAFDMQDSIMPLLAAAKRRGDPLPGDNFDLIRITGEPVDAWDSFESECKRVREEYGPGSFICFDVAGDWWQLVQDAYIEETYGVTTAQFKGQKIIDAVKMDKRGKKVLGFGGLDTDDWNVIKPKYHNTIPTCLGTRCYANIIVTANEKTPAHFKKGDDMVFLESNLPGAFKKELVKPHSESQLASQVSMILWLKHPNDRKWTLSTLGKNRDRLVIEDLDITDSTVWDAYCSEQGRDSEVAPGLPEEEQKPKAKRKGKK